MFLVWKNKAGKEQEREGKNKKEKERLIDQELQVCSSGDNDFVFTPEPHTPFLSQFAPLLYFILNPYPPVL